MIDLKQSDIAKSRSLIIYKNKAILFKMTFFISPFFIRGTFDVAFSPISRGFLQGF